MIGRKVFKTSGLFLFLLLALFLLLQGGISAAEAAGSQPLGDLPLGARVVDPSWEWQFRTGWGYTYQEGDQSKPVTWIVVAKDHYAPGTVTLLSEELIGLHSFDDSTHLHNNGYNHWGESGTDSSAVSGLRPWLNSYGVHSGEGFYRAFSMFFKDAIVETNLPNKRWETGIDYPTEDKVFIPSTTELGDTVHTSTYPIGTVYPYFAGAENADRIAQLKEVDRWYWTRSPASSGASGLRLVRSGGNFGLNDADNNSYGVRPAINLKTGSPVTVTPNAEGVYEILAPPVAVLGDLPIGARVVDLSWEWWFRTLGNYFGPGETKPVTWIVVAKDHYGEGSGVTLLTEELIGRYTFDNAQTPGMLHGHSCWDLSGTHETATRGLRPWLNSSGIHEGEGFYQVFSESFKASIITTTVPNKRSAHNDYTTEDQVFIPSTTELGDTVHTDTYPIGTVYPYFEGAIGADRIAPLYGTDERYWTRSPYDWTQSIYDYLYGFLHTVNQNGALGSTANASAPIGVRPVLNLQPSIVISAAPNEDGVYYIGGAPEPEFAGGAGTAGDPYLVATAEHLNNVRKYLGAHFMQTADIDLGTVPWNAGEGWQPLGEGLSQPFTGCYNGNGYTISNLYIDRPAGEYQGLFGAVGPGSLITNLNLDQLSVTGSYAVGGLVGYKLNGTVNNCHAGGSVNGQLMVGLLIGNNEDGLLAGSSASGAVAGDRNVGGLAGSTRGLVQECFADVSVAGNNAVGGLIGRVWASNGTAGAIENSFALGSVEGNEDVGGLVGYTRGTITNCYAAGQVIGESSSGGLAGESEASNLVHNSYYDQQTTGQSDTNKGIPKTTEQMQSGTPSADIFSGWSTATWSFPPGAYPQLKHFVASTHATLAALSVAPGDLLPAFAPDATTYRAYVSSNVSTISVNAIPSHNGATMLLNGAPVASGIAAPVILGAAGSATVIEIEVTSEDGETKKTYTITVNRSLAGLQKLGDLEIGARVVDPSWEWEFRNHRYYTNSGAGGHRPYIPIIKPVTWIVVAKDHYDLGTGVTLLSEEVIGMFTFDGYDDDGRITGVNHWGDSGTGDATRGLRPWLNSTGIHSGEGFYEAFPPLFRSVTVEISLPNRHWQQGPEGPYWTPGAEYTTVDKVFIPSTTELGDTGHVDTYPIGKAYPFFAGADNADRIALFDDSREGYVTQMYWTRSPSYTFSFRLNYVNHHGAFFVDMQGNAHWSNLWVRPAVNLLEATPVSVVANTDGVYEIWGGAEPEEPTGPTWINIINADAQAIDYADGFLAASFSGVGTGLYSNGSWDLLTPFAAEALATDGHILVASFEGLGVWRYDGEWHQLNTVTARYLAVDEDKVAASFDDYGIWHYDGDWQMLTPATARALAYDNGRLVASVDGFGTWLNDGEWQQLTAETAQMLALSGNDLVASFDSFGTWHYDGEWTNLTPAAARALALDNGMIAASVDGFGTWFYDGEWQQLTVFTAQLLGLDSGSLAVFFEELGGWLYE